MLTQGKRIKAGQEVRLVDIPADAGEGKGCWEVLPNGTSPAEFTRYLKESSLKYYGNAIRSFLKLIPEETHQKFLHEEFEKTREKLEEKYLPGSPDGTGTAGFHALPPGCPCRRIGSAYGHPALLS